MSEGPGAGDPIDGPESYEHLRQLAESVEQVFFLNDAREVRILYVSPAYEAVWGRSRASLYADPTSWLEVVHPDDRGWVREGLRRRGEGSWDEELRLLLDDGTLRWIRSRAYPVKDDEGNVVRIAGVATDITSLKLAEAQARQTEKELREVLERIPVAVAVHHGGRLLYVNRTGLDYLGVDSLEEVLGGDSLAMIHPDDIAGSQERSRRLSETGEPPPPREVRIRHSSGEWRTVLSSPVRTTTFGGVPAQLLVAWDVTDQRRMEAALAESQRRYETVFSSSGVGILVSDEEARVLDANPALQRMLGWDAVPVGLPTREMVHPEDLDAGRPLMDLMRAGSLDAYDRELRVRHADGSWVWCHSHVSAVRDHDGGLSFVSVVDDISEQKRLEEQLRLAQRIESIGRLAGGVAHDFNNLITVIQGHTDLLLTEVEEGRALQADLLQIRTASERAAALTRQLLAFSRRQVLQPRIVGLNTVVLGMEAMLRRLIGEDVRLAFELADDLGVVRADPGQIEQVLLNLVVNARDAMPRGGELVVGTHNRTFDADFVRTHPGATPGPHVAVKVRDDGEGMDQATIDLIFEPFFTTKEPGKGTGLGLAMAYGIVKQSGGYITVESEPGRGSIFSIYLPRVEEDEPESRPPVGAGREKGGSETILLVEDEAMVRELTRRALERQGYGVLTAENGEAALDVFDAHAGSVDLLLTDVVMPNMGGREVAETLRDRVPDLKVVYMSGYTDDAMVRHGVVEENAPFLQKPFTPDELAAKVRAVLDA